MLNLILDISGHSPNMDVYKPVIDQQVISVSEPMSLIQLFEENELTSIVSIFYNYYSK